MGRSIRGGDEGARGARGRRWGEREEASLSEAAFRDCDKPGWWGRGAPLKVQEYAVAVEDLVREQVVCYSARARGLDGRATNKQLAAGGECAKRGEPGRELRAFAEWWEGRLEGVEEEDSRGAMGGRCEEQLHIGGRVCGREAGVRGQLRRRRERYGKRGREWSEEAEISGGG